MDPLVAEPTGQLRCYSREGMPSPLRMDGVGVQHRAALPHAQQVLPPSLGSERPQGSACVQRFLQLIGRGAISGAGCELLTRGFQPTHRVVVDKSNRVVPESNSF
jgi:hypothetical protein